LLLTVGLCCLPRAARAAERFDIEPVAYADDAAAQAAWQPQFGSGPAALAPEKTPDGRPALAFRCDMAQLGERGSGRRRTSPGRRRAASVLQGSEPCWRHDVLLRDEVGRPGSKLVRSLEWNLSQDSQ